MRLITVARKPLSEGTVALNVLKHGCGAINVDASRITTGGGTARPPLSTQQHTGYSRPWNTDPEAHDKRDSLGRWPANLILQHKDGCICVGTTKVKGAPATPSGMNRINAKNAALGYRPNKYEKEASSIVSASRLDVDGNEEIPVWQCEPGCPVADLDVQSGLRAVSGAAKVGAKDTVYQGKGSTFLQSKATATLHNDTGGASRFFKQVKNA